MGEQPVEQAADFRDGQGQKLGCHVGRVLSLRWPLVTANTEPVRRRARAWRRALSASSARLNKHRPPVSACWQRLQPRAPRRGDGVPRHRPRTAADARRGRSARGRGGRRTGAARQPSAGPSSRSRSRRAPARPVGRSNLPKCSWRSRWGQPKRMRAITRKKPATRQGCWLHDGGAKEDRTPDLYNAIVALSQLSYGPTV